MSKKLQLYISSKDTEDNYIEVDLYADEPISIVDSIQDVTDISKIYSTFSRDFKVPASPSNNKLFKHYSNSAIQDGFDGRIRVNALIKVSGQNYRKGFLTLLGASNTNGVATSYKLSFKGSITSLKDKLKDFELKDLDWSDPNFLFDNTEETRRVGIRDGLFYGGSSANDINGDLLYPDLIYAPIFTDFKVVAQPYYNQNFNLGDNTIPTDLEHDFSLVKFTGYGDSNTSSCESDGSNVCPFVNTPVTPYHYRPSVKMSRIIRMIARDYGLEFQREFLELEEIDQMYMLFNGDSDDRSEEGNGGGKAIDSFNNNASSSKSIGEFETQSNTYTTESPAPSGTTLFTGNDNPYDTFTCTTGNYDEMKRVRATLEYNNQSVVDVDITLTAYVYVGGIKTEITSPAQITIPQQSGSISKSLFNTIVTESFYESNMIGQKVHFEATFSSNQDTNGDLSASLDTYVFVDAVGGQDPEPAYFEIKTTGNNAVVSTFSFLNIQQYAPEIKLMDILTGIFKMFNMTAYVNSDNEIVIQRLADYYANGNTHNITEMVDTSQNGVASLGFKYKDVLMGYQKPKDVMTSKYVSSQSSVGYGDIRVNKSTFLEVDEETTIQGLDEGKDFKIKLPFQRMMFENLTLAFKRVFGNTQPTNGVFSESVSGMKTDIVIGNCIDDKLERVETKPIVFYGKQVNTFFGYETGFTTPANINQTSGRKYPTGGFTERGNSAGINGKLAAANTGVSVGDAGTGGRGLILTTGVSEESENVYGLTKITTFAGGTTSAGKWWNPSSIMASRYRRDRTTLMNTDGKFQSIGFDNDTWDEFEYANNLAPQEWITGLYHANYEDYLSRMYSKEARVYKFTIKLSQAVLSQYQLNDTFIVGTKEYNINKINVDLLTGNGTIELINKLNLPTI